MIPILLFATTVVALVPLLQRDIHRAVRRRRTRQIRVTFTVVDRFSPAMRRAGLAATGLGAMLGMREFTRAAADAEASMAKIAAVMQVRPEDVRYRLRIQHERDLAQAYLGVQLDGWCRSYGWNPVQVWRRPRWDEQQRQLWRDRDRMDSLLLAYRVAAAVTLPPPSSVLTLGSGA